MNTFNFIVLLAWIGCTALLILFALEAVQKETKKTELAIWLAISILAACTIYFTQ